MKTIEALQILENELKLKKLKRLDHLWGFSHVGITKKLPKKSEGGSYPDPRYVVTDYAFELSWLFEELKNIFYELLDGCSKVEFYGRLANAANKCLNRNQEVTAHLLCAAVLHEAYSIFEEMEEGTFTVLPIAIGNEFADDYIDENLKNGFIGVDETIAFFKSHGVDIYVSN